MCYLRKIWKEFARTEAILEAWKLSFKRSLQEGIENESQLRGYYNTWV